jgi:hypothetical protein
LVNQYHNPIKTKVGKRFNSPTFVETKILVHQHCAITATKMIPISLNINILEVSISEIVEIVGDC